MWFTVVAVERTLVRFTVTVIADVVWNKTGQEIENENGGTRFSATMFLSDNIKDIVFKPHSMGGPELPKRNVYEPTWEDPQRRTRIG